jgi:hypothetical protein
LAAVGRANAQKDLDAVVESLAAVGLKVSVKKTEYMQLEDRRYVRPTAPATTFPAPIKTAPNGALYFIMTRGSPTICPFPTAVCKAGDARKPGAPHKSTESMRKHLQTCHGIVVNVLESEPTIVNNVPPFPKVTQPSRGYQCPDCLRVIPNQKQTAPHWRTAHEPQLQDKYGYEVWSGRNMPLIMTSKATHNNEPMTSAHHAATAAAHAPPDNTPLSVYGKPIKRVHRFTYLGRIIRDDDKDEEAIEHRISVAMATWMSLHKRFFSKKIVDVNTKCKVWKAIISAQLVYGSESWVMSSRAEDKLRTFQQRTLRMATHMWPKPMADGSIRYPKSEDVLKKAGMPDIILMIHKMQLRFIGHISRHPLQQSCFTHCIPGPGKPGFTNTGHSLAHYYNTLMKNYGLAPQLAHDRNEWRRVTGLLAAVQIA